MTSEKVYSEWFYDEPFYRQLLDTGNLNVNSDDLYRKYAAWVNVCSIGIFKNQENGLEIRKLLARRGNRAYADKHKKSISELVRGFDRLQFDYPIENTRTDRLCHGLFITLTYDHKRFSLQEAWERSSKDVTNFKRHLARVMKVDKLDASICVKEAQENSGYPAPHLFIVVSRPVRCVRWVSKIHKISWRLNENIIYHNKRLPLKDALAQVWGHGFIDIEATVKGQVNEKNVLTYMFKYVTKAVDIKKSGSVGIMTNAWHKLYHYRAGQISSCFKALKNRLEPLLSESPQVNSVWVFMERESLTQDEYFRSMLTKDFNKQWFHEEKPLDPG